ncbi:hypothetical protein FPOAC2_07333 [Fusarium poae]
MEFSLLCLLSVFTPAMASFSGGFELSNSFILSRSNNPVSKDGNCGSNSDFNATCLTSTFGNCCSEKGFCGKTVAYCAEGCQSGFGTCGTSDGQLVSISGSCGATSSSNITCQGSEFGNCCSEKGYCGKTSTYCGAGCQSGFGTCDSDDKSSSVTTATTATRGTSTSSAASETSLGAVSVDGNCGSNSDINAICEGSEFGDCCSEKGYCGGSSNYCGTGCQSDFGSCDTLIAEKTSTINPTGFTRSSATSSPLSSDSADSSTGSLSTGAKAGIAVGSVVGGLGLIGLLAWFLIRRKNRKSAPSVMEVGEEKPESAPRYELKGENHAELDGGGTRAELPGDYGSHQR